MKKHNAKLTPLILAMLTPLVLIGGADGDILVGGADNRWLRWRTRAAITNSGKAANDEASHAWRKAA